MTLLAGTEYELGRELGRGGMGITYFARHTVTGRECAIKVVRPDRVAVYGTERRFLREAKALGLIRHRNVVDITDSRMLPSGQFIIVMEYVDGVTLATLMRRGEVSLGKTLNYLSQTLLGLQAAHDMDVVHRDVKPGNIMIGRDKVVKVIDFGLAKGLGLQGDDCSTVDGTFLGTPRYASPEQANGQPMTAASDIYSVGVVLYECLSGQPPFCGDSHNDILYAHAHHPPPALVGDCANHPRLQEVVRRALAKRPDDRFATAAEFANELQEVVRLQDWPTIDDGVMVPEKYRNYKPPPKADLDRSMDVSVQFDTIESHPAEAPRELWWSTRNQVMAGVCAALVTLVTLIIYIDVVTARPIVADHGNHRIPARVIQMAGTASTTVSSAMDVITRMAAAESAMVALVNSTALPPASATSVNRLSPPRTATSRPATPTRAAQPAAKPSAPTIEEDTSAEALSFTPTIKE
jgi:serine/threonine protein kinase